MKTNLPLVLAIILCATAVAGCSDPNRVGRSDDLSNAALNAATPEEKEKAAADLARSNAADAPEALYQLLESSKDADVLSQAMEGISFKKDRDLHLKSLPRLLRIVQDEKGTLDTDDAMKIKQVRGRAHWAITIIVGASFNWDVEKEQTPEEVAKLNTTVSFAQGFMRNPPPASLYNK
ncbi:MAG TPA: hypothetical protein VE988_25110 [Gemmataceae bacterium]|nr:hypothetical protein [Gemmataceae bacterium]